MSTPTADARALARRKKLYYKVCRHCGVRNAPTAKKCRKCHRKNLRWKKRELGMKK